MLWQKESTHKNALYADLCQSMPNNSKPIEEMYTVVEQSLETNKVFYEKCDEVAEQYLTFGKESFDKKKWAEALENWNMSLCFAENRSKLLGIIYRHRALYFLMMKMFKNCLIDIELAKEHRCPPEKLEGMQNTCQMLMQTEKDQSECVNPKLDFKANANFPSLAYNVEILYNSDYGRHIIATDNIGVGKTVMVERSYLGENVFDRYKTCTICRRTRINLKPCRHCTKALLCPGCETNDLHRADCNFNLGPSATFFDISLVRSIWLAKNAFQNVYELVGFVEKMLTNQPLPPLTEEQSKYQSFFNLCTIQNSEMAAQSIYLLHQKVLNQPKMGTFFKSKGSKRFLMHMICHHMMIIRHVTHTIRYRSADGKLNIKSHQLSITASYFNHSCLPNACIVHGNGFVSCVTIRPLRKHDQLVVTYIDNIDEIFPRINDRQKVLRNRYNFQCACDLCYGNKATISTPQIQVDKDYRYIQSLFKFDSLANDLYKREEIEQMKSKCCRFLTKHAPCKFSTEMAYIAKVFSHLIRRSTSNLK